MVHSDSDYIVSELSDIEQHAYVTSCCMFWIQSFVVQYTSFFQNCFLGERPHQEENWINSGLLKMYCIHQKNKILNQFNLENLQYKRKFPKCVIKIILAGFLLEHKEYMYFYTSI